MAVKPGSQEDNDSNSNEFLAKFLHTLGNHLGRIAHNTERPAADIDYYNDDSGATGQVILDDQVKGPYVITDVIATWIPAGATSATITIEDRVLQLNPTAGVFSLSLTKGMLVDNHSKVQFVVVPAAACFFEIQGHSDTRKMQ
jgi:hypothetical protein